MFGTQPRIPGPETSGIQPSVKQSLETQALELVFEAARADDPSAIFLDLTRRKAFRANGRFSKFGPDVDINEAKAMSFVAESTHSVPVPKVFRAKTFEDGTTVVETKYILGKTLQESWPTLSVEEKKSFANE
ncbi:hypothetical protein A1O7_03355 [Cladophialophora yegresii CBS 114405]|uniref:Aminoglycoside phosphotransferase domain-containing protein n=1 Tax=Cladophialophora yegresii CBS 114405 TaxID=1182544 RepID=W9W4B6_9EURO|nr:uncharacterized protein A1O7_03355 [Cladophialophora yegresii CBS 114405]EXJ62912.1 hypothetical protein A1O7_03355 [Cladophialophora yegresii CBS 114405]